VRALKAADTHCISLKRPSSRAGHGCAGRPRDAPRAPRAPQDPAAALTDARARLAKVWADLDEDAHRREAALPFRLPGPGHAPALTGRCAAPVCAACACARQYATHRQTA